MHMTHTRQPRQTAKFFFLMLALSLVFTASAFAENWIHVKVENANDEEYVTVNLPLSLMQAAVNMIPQDIDDDVNIAIDDLNMSWSELRAFWQEVKKAPEATFVTVQSKDETVKVRKEGDFVYVRTTEASDQGAKVDVQFPLAVVDALLDSPDGTLNFQGAMQALADFGPGNLMSIQDGDETVRIWIDDQNEVD